MMPMDRLRVQPVLVGGAIAYMGLLALALIVMHLSPLVVLVFMVAGIGMAALVLNPLFGVHTLVLLLFVEDATATESGITAMKFVGPIVILAWIISLAARQKTRIHMSAFVVVLALFIGWCSLSLLYAIDSEMALVRLLTFVQLAVVAILFMSVVNDLQRVRGVLWAIVIWATATTLLGLGMYAVGRETVVTGPAMNRNQFAVYVNIAIICGLLLFQDTRSRWARFFLVVALPILLVGQALTFSRKGIIALLFALSMIWYRFARERRLLPLIATVMALSLIAWFLPEVFWQRVATIVPAIQERKDTFGIRVNLWQLALHMIKERPLTGVGLGNFVPAFARYAEGQMHNVQLVAHNAYMSIAAETGIIGLALFLFLHAFALRDLRRAIRIGASLPTPDLKLLAIATEVSLIVIMVTALSGSTEALKVLWFLFGLSVALGRLASEARAPAREVNVLTARNPLGSGVAT